MFNIYNMEVHWRLFIVTTIMCTAFGIILASGMTFKLKETKENRQAWWRIMGYEVIFFGLFFTCFCAIVFLSGWVPLNLK